MAGAEGISAIIYSALILVIVVTRMTSLLIEPDWVQSILHTYAKDLLTSKTYNQINLAGAEGIEPPNAVLETTGLPLAYAPKTIKLEILNPKF